MATDDLAARVMDVLKANRVLTLACRDADGCWAAAVYYVVRGHTLVFCSSAKSRHVRALQFDARQAGEVHADSADWRSILGVQLSGRVEGVSAGEVEDARRDYAARFPFVDDNADPVLAQALRGASWFRYRIERAVLIDNANGFGQRLAWDVREAPG